MAKSERGLDEVFQTEYVGLMGNFEISGGQHFILGNKIKRARSLRVV